MKKVNSRSRNGQNIAISAVINFPEGFDESKKYSAVVVSHPGVGVKEQTGGTYAKKLAEQGFIAIAYDASYQGESTGEPRQLENPSVRTEDVSAVIDYLTTLPYVDKERIGDMGICVGAGYTANAAINDHRVKPVGTVSAVNIGQMSRNGFTHCQVGRRYAVACEGASARTGEADGAPIEKLALAPLKKEDAPSAELEEAWEYYHTARAQYPTAGSGALPHADH